MTHLTRRTFAAALLAASIAGPRSAFAQPDPAFAELAKKIPGFRLISNMPPVPPTVFFDADNQRTTLLDFEGKALLINFWATWCTPCVREMPALNALARDFSGQGVEVVAIASGQQLGKNPDVFLQENQLESLALYRDPHSSLMKLFAMETLPTTLLADRAGRILGGVVGATDWDSEPARATLAYLAEQS